MADLLTLPEAKEYLNVIDETQDATIETLISAASEIVLDYANQADPNADVLKVAAFLVIADLFANREGRPAQNSSEEVGLSSTVKNILRRYRDPALA